MLDNRILKNLCKLHVLTIGMIVISCNGISDDTEEYVNSGISTRSVNTEYIELDLSNLNIEDSVTFALYTEARDRINQYINYKNGKYVLEINNGTKIGISESLFLHFKQVMEQTNERIKDLCLIEIRPNELIEVSPNSAITLNTLQNYNSEPGGGGLSDVKSVRTNYWWGYIETITLNNSQAITYFKSVRDTYSWGAGTMVGISLTWSPAMASIGVSLASQFNSSMYDNWYEEARSSGASYEITDVCQPMDGTASSHTYTVKKL